MGLVIRQLHRSNHRLDERSLIICQTVFRAKLAVGPIPVPRLHRHPRVSRVGGVLSDLPQGHKEPEKPRRVVRPDTLCLLARLQVEEQERLGTNGWRWRNKWWAKYEVNARPLTLSARTHLRDKQFPRIYEMGTLG